MARLLDWRERKEQVGPKKMAHEKVAILKHVFDPKEFEVCVVCGVCI